MTRMSTSDEEPAERERHVRGKALVTKVLSAAVAELARVGYEKLSIEDVAVAAGSTRRPFTGAGQRSGI